jgi:hypothetical protein
MPEHGDGDRLWGDRRRNGRLFRACEVAGFHRDLASTSHQGNQGTIKLTTPRLALTSHTRAGIGIRFGQGTKKFPRAHDAQCSPLPCPSHLPRRSAAGMESESRLLDAANLATYTDSMQKTTLAWAKAVGGVVSRPGSVIYLPHASRAT